MYIPPAVDRDIFAGKVFHLLNIRVVYFSSHTRMYVIHHCRLLTNVHKIFHVFNFCRERSSKKNFFKDKSFPIYGI